MGAVAGLVLTGILGASAGPNDLTASTHQGQAKVNGVLGSYVSGNVTTYTELDPFNMRFTLTATDAGAGEIEVRYSGQDECLFFDGSFALGTHDGSAPAVQPVSGAVPTVTVDGAPTVDDDEWVQVLDVSFAGAGQAIVHYFVTLSDEAGECSGASQHTRLANRSGDFKNLGAQNTPVPANQVIELPELTVTKMIDRDGNGSFEDTAAAGEFCFTLDLGDCIPTDAAGNVVFSNVMPDGAHTVTETQLVFTGGTYEFASGSGTNCVFDGATATATVAAGTTSMDATCVFNNRPAASTLTVTKIVENGGFGTALVSDFDLFIDDTQVTSGVAEELAAGDYVVSEADFPGYVRTISGDCAPDGNVSLLPGDAKACTITNVAQPATLTVIKVVDNNGVGTALVSDFDLFIDDTEVTSGVAEELAAGDYVVSEADFPGYVGTISGDCDADGSITLALGESGTCTITNVAQPATLTVTKIVENNNGGTAVVGDFDLFVDGTEVTSGVAAGFAAGDHTVTETNLPGYVGTFSGDCDENGSVILALGETAECVITNVDQPATLTVTKIVINNDGGTAVVGDFPLFVNQVGVTSGVPGAFPAGTYTVSETNLTGYTATIGGDCAANGSITLTVGETATCTITNNDLSRYGQGGDDPNGDDPYGDDPADQDDDPYTTPTTADPGAQAAGDSDGLQPVVSPPAAAPSTGGEQLPQQQPEGILPLTSPVAAAELPRTGSNGVGGLVASGSTMILLGLAALMIGRRRAIRTV